jgi:DNA-directed RNA polymerase specialized sigma24 family protein
MQIISVPPQIDPILLPYLYEADEAVAESLLCRLLSEQASPVIKQIVSYKLRSYSNSHAGHSYSDDADDLHNDAIINLMRALRERKTDPNAKPIPNFRGYTAKIAYRACYDHFRLHNPLRHKLKNRLRYVLDPRYCRHPDLISWEDASGEIVCGFVAWRDAHAKMARNDALEGLLADPYELAGAGHIGQDFKRMNLAELMATIFDFVGGPVELDKLVTIVAALQGINVRTESLDAAEEDGYGEYLKDPRAGVDQEITQRNLMRHAWEEIRQLPIQQRKALLLNLKDGKGNCLTTLLPGAGIASIRQIAEVLQIPQEEFYRLWRDLPLADVKIAELLGLTSQQVINLRKAARERLARRMKALEK